jgi:hypothetical protein
MLKRRREAVFDVYNLVIGAFLFMSPWLLGLTRENARLDIWAVGAAIVVLSLAAILLFSEWEEWLNLLLACWLIVSPWVLGFAHTRAMHWAIGLGIVSLCLSALELWMIHYDQPDQQLQHQRVELDASDRRWLP